MQSVSPQLGLYDVRTQLKDYVYRRSESAFAAGDAARDAVQSIEQLDARRKELRSKFIENLGGLPPSDAPLNPRNVGTIDCDGFKIEKIIFESRPKTYVTANLYVPDGITAPRGAVLFVCGHWPEAKHAPEYQIVCRYLAKAGLVVLAQDPIGQGERFSYYEKSLGAATIESCCLEHDYAGWQSFALGFATARYFVHDSMRSIDYLMTRPEVDPDKIGVTGNSGGGTQTSLMMVCDPRVAAAAPTTFIMNREIYMHVGGAQDQEQIWPGMTALGFDHEDILLMMTPKPVQVQAVTYDFFPIEGTRRTAERSKRFWDMYGKAENFGLVEDASVHHYTRNLARAAAEFFSKHLLGKMVTPVDSEIDSIEPSKLWCCDFGQVRAEFDDARAIHEENCDRAAELEAQSNSIPPAERKERALSWLRDQVVVGRTVCDLNPRLSPPVMSSELAVESCCWWSQPGLLNHGLCIRHFEFAGQTLPVTVALWPDGSRNLHQHIRWIRETCESGRAVLVLNVTAAGAIELGGLQGGHVLGFYGAMHKLTDDLFWLSDSVAAIRAYDVLRVLDMVGIWPGLSADDIRFYCHGRYDVYPRLAAALDSRIKGIQSVDGMGSYADWAKSRYYEEHDIPGFVLPGMLQYFDLADLDG